MIVYPESGYNSFISEDDADEYFETRLNTSAWDTTNKEAALMTAFRSLQELGIDLTDTDSLAAIKQAQCEQALHELICDLDAQPISSFSLGGSLSIKFPESKALPDRFSKRAFAVSAVGGSPGLRRL